MYVGYLEQHEVAVLDAVRLREAASRETARCDGHRRDLVERVLWHVAAERTVRPDLRIEVSVPNDDQMVVLLDGRSERFVHRLLELPTPVETVADFSEAHRTIIKITLSLPETGKTLVTRGDA